MLTSNVDEAYGFVRSKPELEFPDLELIFASALFFDEGICAPYTGHAVVMGPILLKPMSAGFEERRRDLASCGAIPAGPS